MEDSTLSSILLLNISGYFLWQDLYIENIKRVIIYILDGRLFVASRSIENKILEITRRSSSTPVPEVPVRELTILCDLAAGMTQAHIAKEHGWSERTVRRLVQRLEERFEAGSSFMLGANATQLGLIP